MVHGKFFGSAHLVAPLSTNTATDAALGIDLGEVGFLRPSDDAESGDRAAVRQGLADADFFRVVSGGWHDAGQSQRDRQYMSRQSHRPTPGVYLFLSSKRAR
jgi:hypothetical protein